jgi:plastocyanin
VRVVLAVLAGAARGGAAPAPRGANNRRIYDNYFVADSLTVKRGTTVVWRWPGAGEAGDVHDVKLKSGPKGAKRFHSEAASTDYSFRRKLKVRGRYRIVCTLHEEMTMTIRVRA